MPFRLQKTGTTRLPDITNRLNQLTIPVLLVWATHDALSPLAVAYALAAKIPSASMVTFPSDDHSVAQRVADKSAAAIGTSHLEARVVVRSIHVC